MIYLDYAANTPVSDGVIKAFREGCEYIGNPNSSHPAGVIASRRLESAAEQAALLLGVDPSCLIWTSGASESNNLGIKGLFAGAGNRKKIITTPFEHPSIYGPIKALEEEFRCEIIQVDEIEPDEDTALIAVSLVGSELGNIQDITALYDRLRDFPDVRLHIDATQAIGKLTLEDLRRIPWNKADTVSLSAHKIFGLNGSGLLLKKRHLILEPIIHGGDSTTPYRSGTPTLALDVSLTQALKEIYDNYEERWNYVKELSDYLKTELSAIDRVKINTPSNSVPHIVNLSAEGIKGSVMQRELSKRDICVSVKSACSSDGLPSKAVIAVTGGDSRRALESWRISLSHLTTRQEVDTLVDAVGDIVG